MSELPIRIIDQSAGPVVRCMCGLELARLWKSTVNDSMVGLRSSGPAMRRLGPDLSWAGLLAMVAHAQQCAHGRARLANESGPPAVAVGAVAGGPEAIATPDARPCTAYSTRKDRQ